MKKQLNFEKEEYKAGMVDSYSYQKINNSNMVISYKFITEDEDKYMVRFYQLGYIQNKRNLMGKYQIESVTCGENGDTIVLNKGRFYKVISTIVSIIREFIIEYYPKEIKIKPVVNFKKDKRRKNIYIRYIENLLPDEYKYKKSFFGDYLLIKKK